MGKENWLPVARHTGYEVSDMGRLRTDRARNGRGKTKGWRIIKGSVRKTGGYVFVAIADDEGRPIHWQMHRLVLLAFVGTKPDGMETRHLNGVRHDNRLTNLQYGTRKENAADKIRHGTHATGEHSPNAKLTGEQVRRMLKRRAEGRTYQQLADEFRVSESAAIHACKGQSYKAAAIRED